MRKGGIIEHHFGEKNPSFGHLTRRRGGGEGGSLGFEASMDRLHSSSSPPTLINGIYSFAGSEMTLRTQVYLSLNDLLGQGMQVQQHMMGDLSMQQFTQTPIQQFTPPIQTFNPLGPSYSAGMAYQLNVHLVGNKTKSTNNCCFLLTLCVGGCCIFPLCFMCCSWWKKMVYPKYELSLQAYRDIATLTERHPTANSLNLTVVDSAFNAQKARILFDALSRGQITSFAFVNQALDCNGQFNQIDDFRNNMMPIKSLSHVNSSIIWGSVIV